MRRREFLLALGGIALAACAAPRVSASATPVNPLLAMPLKGVWPIKYENAPQPVRDAYAYAVDHRAQLRYIPCFCGCGEEFGHRNNWDCFVKEQPAPNTFILEPHGFGCGTCVYVALDAKAMLADGRSLLEVRKAIDAKWKAAGPATRTPYPDE
jgi:nitroreductase